MNFMIRKFLLLFVIVALIACKSNDTSKKNTADSTVSNLPLAFGELALSGTIKGMDTGRLELQHLDGNTTKTDYLDVFKGKFTFKTALIEPTRFILKPAEAEEVQPLVFFADPGAVIIDGDIDALHKASVKGGKSQDEFKIIVDEIEGIFAKAEPYYQKFSEARQSGDVVTTEKIQHFFDSLRIAANKFIMDYAGQHPSSLVAAAILVMNPGNNTDISQFAALYEGFSDPVKKSQPGKNLKAVIEAQKNTSAGGTAADFTQNDPMGKPVTLSSFRGNYTLIDFWASWCGPCRAENPNVVAAYNRYKSKGFQILGVSLDDSKENWLAAINKDKLTWKQVSDLKGWENTVAQLYRIQSIPANFLLDKDGKIIATDLRGEALEQKLAELMP